MRIAVTTADQAVARLNVSLAEELGEKVDPRVKVIAEADLTRRHSDTDLPPPASAGTVWIDDQTGEVVAAEMLRGPSETTLKVHDDISDLFGEMDEDEKETLIAKARYYERLRRRQQLPVAKSSSEVPTESA